MLQHEGGQLLLTENQQLVPDSYLRYRSLPIDMLEVVSEEEIYLKEPIIPTRKEKGNFVLLGNFSMDHFGHMIIECLSRFWLTFELNLPKYKFVVYQEDLTSDAKFYLKALGIPLDSIYHLTNPTQFESLIIPNST